METTIEEFSWGLFLWQTMLILIALMALFFAVKLFRRIKNK